MKQFWRTHKEWLLIGAGIFLAAAIALFLVWGVATVADHLGTALASPHGGTGGTRFDVEGAARLDFKGLP